MMLKRMGDNILAGAGGVVDAIEAVMEEIAWLGWSGVNVVPPTKSSIYVYLKISKNKMSIFPQIHSWLYFLICIAAEA